jgi:hypothetical protein
MKTITNEHMINVGSIEGDAYTNKFFGVKYALPEGFRFYNVDQLEAANRAIIQTNKDQAVLEAYKSGIAFFDMVATAVNDPSFSIVIQIAGSEGSDLDEAEYFEVGKDKIIQQLNDVGFIVKSVETGTHTNQNTGDEFSAIKLAIEKQGTPLYEEIICIKAGDCYMNATVSAADEAGLVFVLDHLTHTRGND